MGLCDVFAIRDSRIANTWYNIEVIAAVDVYVLLKIALVQDKKWDQAMIASSVIVSPSTVHQTLKRAGRVQLFDSVRRRVNVLGFEKALTYGAKYFLGVEKGGFTRGIPTGWSVGVYNSTFAATSLTPVWPDPKGLAEGFAVEPLYPTAPRAALLDNDFYELLATVDILRIGSAREISMAQDELRRLLKTQ